MSEAGTKPTVEAAVERVMEAVNVWGREVRSGVSPIYHGKAYAEWQGICILKAKEIEAVIRAELAAVREEGQGEVPPVCLCEGIFSPTFGAHHQPTCPYFKGQGEAAAGPTASGLVVTDGQGEQPARRMMGTEGAKRGIEHDWSVYCAKHGCQPVTESKEA